MLLITIKSVLILVKMYHDLEYRLVKEFHGFPLSCEVNVGFLAYTFPIQKERLLFVYFNTKEILHYKYTHYFN